MLMDLFEKVPEYMKAPLLQHFFMMAQPESDESKGVWRLFERLLKYGCPIDAIIKTLDDMISDGERDAIRKLLGDGFNILFEGEE